MTAGRRWLAAAAAVHLALTVGHGLVHGAIPVPVRDWQYGYAGVVAVLGPTVGLGLLARDRTVAGAWLLLLTGLAALAFEGPFHFVVANPDHVGTVTDGRALFAVSAALSTAGDAALAAVAAVHLARTVGSRSC